MNVKNVVQSITKVWQSLILHACSWWDFHFSVIGKYMVFLSPWIIWKFSIKFLVEIQTIKLFFNAIFDGKIFPKIYTQVEVFHNKENNEIQNHIPGKALRWMSNYYNHKEATSQKQGLPIIWGGGSWPSIM